MTTPAAPVAESLRQMVDLAKQCDVPALQAERERLKLRLEAVENLLAWRERLNAVADFVPAQPAPIVLAKTVDPTPVTPLPGTTPDVVLPGRRHTPHFTPPEQRSVDSQDPPPKYASRDRFPKLEPAETEELLEDTPDNVWRTQELLKLPDNDLGKRRAEILAKLVMLAGNSQQEDGCISLLDMIQTLNLTRKFVQNTMNEPRVKRLIDRVAHGRYALTVEGRELYDGLREPQGKKRSA